MHSSQPTLGPLETANWVPRCFPAVHVRGIERDSGQVALPKGNYPFPIALWSSSKSKIFTWVISLCLLLIGASERPDTQAKAHMFHVKRQLALRILGW